MVQLPLYNASGENSGALTAAKEIFGRELNEAVVHSALLWYLASQRRGTHSSLTRAEVSGGGKKPWKQKGTGRARAGSTRSPLWRKGGVTFGPKPRDYGYSLPQKQRILAAKVVLSDKAKAGKVVVVESWRLEQPKTKLAAALLRTIGVVGPALVLVGQENPNFTKAARNLAGITVLDVKAVNIFALLKADWVVLDKTALASLEGVLAS